MVELLKLHHINNSLSIIEGFTVITNYNPLILVSMYVQDFINLSIYTVWMSHHFAKYVIQIFPKRMMTAEVVLFRTVLHITAYILYTPCLFLNILFLLLSVCVIHSA